MNNFFEKNRLITFITKAQNKKKRHTPHTHKKWENKLQ